MPVIIFSLMQGPEKFVLDDKQIVKFSKSW